MKDHGNMPAGIYWIGDLCYVMHERWEEVCELTIKGNDVLDGIFTMRDGTVFAMMRTHYGDGTYLDEKLNEYGVDSGTIGCILASSINRDHLDNDIDCGHLHTFKLSFPVVNNNGTLHFGFVQIDTLQEEEDEDGYDPYEDEDE